MSNSTQATVADAGEPDQGRRTILLATCVAGGGAAAATAWPFIASMNPSERAKAAGAPVEADISGMAPGDQRVFEWRGKPVWVLRRSPEMLAATMFSLSAGRGTRSPGMSTVASSPSRVSRVSSRVRI